MILRLGIFALRGIRSRIFLPNRCPCPGFFWGGISPPLSRIGCRTGWSDKQESKGSRAPAPQTVRLLAGVCSLLASGTTTTPNEDNPTRRGRRNDGSSFVVTDNLRSLSHTCCSPKRVSEQAHAVFTLQPDEGLIFLRYAKYRATPGIRRTIPQYGKNPAWTLPIRVRTVIRSPAIRQPLGAEKQKRRCIFWLRP